MLILLSYDVDITFIVGFVE